MRPATAHEAIEALKSAVYGRTPEYEKLATRHEELWDELEKHVGDEGRRVLMDLDALIGELISQQYTQGFRFGYQLGESGLLKGTASGSGEVTS